jgi:membrane protein
MTGSGMVRHVAAVFGRARRRLGWLDHVIRAGVRYDHADGGRLAAAVTYYAFFATFALALLAFATLGYVVDNPTVLHAVQEYLATNVARLDPRALRYARGTAGLIAFIVLPVAGLWWVDALRSSIRAIWLLPQYPGKFLLRQLIDLGMLASLGLLSAASLAAAIGAKALLKWLLLDAAGGHVPQDRWLLNAGTLVLAAAVNALLAIAILSALPRLRMQPRRVLGPALLIAAGLEILKTAGALYVHRTQVNPAYQVVAGAVGLLVFLDLLNQLILFAAALTATSTLGTVTDLAAAAMPTEPTKAAATQPLHPTGHASVRSRSRYTRGRHPPSRRQ